MRRIKDGDDIEKRKRLGQILAKSVARGVVEIKIRAGMSEIMQQ